jgi:hypothetical protein
MLLSLSTLSVFLLPSFAQQVPAASLASTYSLTSSTSFPFPSATESSDSSASFIVSQWSLGHDRIQQDPQNIAFVDDPFPDNPAPNSASNSSTGPVLQVTYPQGSYSGGTGGTQFINLWNSSTGSGFNSMLLTYEVAFDTGFDFVKGGKLPGIRGGLNSTGCSGGSEADGSTCFSARVMWRTNGAGEIYAYIPETDGLCKEKNIICNSDFGISMSRGSFTFAPGQWNSITLLVLLNDPSSSNGVMQLYFNEDLTINQTGLQIRTDSSLMANGLFFSTFFGGSDSSFATPQTVHTYFRNLQLWGGSAESNYPNAAVPLSRGMSVLSAVLMIACLYQLV